MNRRVIGSMLAALAVVIAAAGILAYLVLSRTTDGIGPGTATPGIVGDATVVAGKGCGVTKTSTGYRFSWLHVADGLIVDEHNCIVDLKGFNWSELEFNNGVGGSGPLKISAQSMAWFNQNFQMNLWRLPLNTTWWNENVYVPDANMNYRDWVQQVVKWAEDNGDYVILTKGPQFSNPPCGGVVTFCPSQDQGEKNIAADPTNPAVQAEGTSGNDISAGVTMWTGVVRFFANDPAVLYNSWNEMHDIDPATWKRNQDTLIATIRAENPRSLILLSGTNFGGNMNAVVKNKVPNFTQPNIVYDFHVYNGETGTYLGKPCVEPLSYVWQNWPSHADEQIGFAQQHDNAAAISEWGGCDAPPDYSSAIASYARTHHVLLAYYNESNVVSVATRTLQLDDNGLRVQQAYAGW